MTQTGPDTQFGDPHNPLDEPRQLSRAATSLTSEILRATSSDIVSFMSEFRSEVMAQAIGNYTARSLRIDCTAPFESSLGLYLNGAQHIMDGIEVTDVTPREPTVIHIGDVVSGSEAIVNRWARLSRKTGELFGVSGVSSVSPGGKIEQWSALTMTITRGRSKPRAELWGETAEKDAVDLATKLSQGSNQEFESHFFAMHRGIGRSLRKRTGTSS